MNTETCPLLKTSSDLKYWYERLQPDGHFFDRKTMKFFGDKMKNYGIRYIKDKTIIELYRRHPVKHGLAGSAFFDAKTLDNVSWRETLSEETKNL